MILKSGSSGLELRLVLVLGIEVGIVLGAVLGLGVVLEMGSLLGLREDFLMGSEEVVILVILLVDESFWIVIL